jgi:hypothetical protein
MTPMEWLIVIGGLAAIMWINWYFFLSQRRLLPDNREDRDVVARPSDGNTTSCRS